MATKKTSNILGGLSAALKTPPSNNTSLGKLAALPPEVPAPPPTVAESNEPPFEHAPIPGAVESVCPCGKPVTGHKCRFCGAVKTTNSVTGNVIWMRNGRIAAAFQDAKTAYVEMAKRYSIPQDRWPVEFRDPVLG